MSTVWQNMTDAERADVASKARQMRKDHMSWRGIGVRIGVDFATIRRHIDPGYREMRRGQRAATKAAKVEAVFPCKEPRHVGDGRPGRIGHAAMREAGAEAKSRVPIDTRTMTARFFGDPLPGRSALDMRKKARARKSWMMLVPA